MSRPSDDDRRRGVYSEPYRGRTRVDTSAGVSVLGERPDRTSVGGPRKSREIRRRGGRGRPRALERFIMAPPMSFAGLTTAPARKFPITMVRRSLRTGAGVLASCLLLAGCGGDDTEAPQQPTTSSQATLPAALAEELARASDEVAARLAAGDDCEALDAATRLREQALAAVERGDVPDGLADPLLAAVGRLAGEIACDEHDDEGGEKGEDHGRGKGHAYGKKDGEAD
jgi:hypothetical protein